MNQIQSPQLVIEAKMKEISELGHYDMVHLFSSEGLPLAEFYGEVILSKDRLAELSLLFREVRKMADVMGQISSIKEMIIEGYNRRKIVFRFFQAFDQEVILAIVVPPRKAYRGLTNSLVRLIERIPY
ncbi:MAG: hypothetical protein ACE5HO_02540 [bacterium]